MRKAMIVGMMALAGFGAGAGKDAEKTGFQTGEPVGRAPPRQGSLNRRLKASLF